MSFDGSRSGTPWIKKRTALARLKAQVQSDSRQQAEGIVQSDYDRMRRQQFELSQLEQDARQAIKLHEEYPGAHFLLGYVRRHDYTPFVVYRLIAAAVIVLIIVSGWRHATF